MLFLQKENYPHVTMLGMVVIRQNEVKTNQTIKQKNMKQIAKLSFASSMLDAFRNHFYAPLFVAALCLTFASCSSDNDNNNGEERYTIKELEEYNFKHVSISKVNDYLYEIDNADYYPDYYYNPFASGSEFNGVSKWHGVCAGVRNGDLCGRNLDWSCSHQPEFVVHTPAKNGKHATLGICATGMIKTPPADGWLSQMLVNDLTKGTYDGINDAGVYMVVLVVHHADDIITTGTNTKAAKSIHGSNVVRYVLDNASSAADAVRLLKEVNVYGTLEDYAFHWLLCDEKENYFVELINNSVVASKCEANSVNPEYSKPVITNFYMLKPYDRQVYPEGVERYALLSNDYAKTNTVSGMFAALENVRFSKKYLGKDPKTLADGEPDPNFYSEYYLSVPNYEDYTKGFLVYDKNSDRQEMWDHCIKFDIEKNSLYKMYELGVDPRNQMLTSWTCHTSVYNLKEKTMQVVIGEKYNDILPSATTSFRLKK